MAGVAGLIVSGLGTEVVPVAAFAGIGFGAVLTPSRESGFGFGLATVEPVAAEAGFGLGEATSCAASEAAARVIAVSAARLAASFKAGVGLSGNGLRGRL
jgi:hypothetical protein